MAVLGCGFGQVRVDLVLEVVRTMLLDPFGLRGVLVPDIDGDPDEEAFERLGDVVCEIGGKTVVGLVIGLGGETEYLEPGVVHVSEDVVARPLARLVLVDHAL